MLTISILNYKNWRKTMACVRDVLAACQGLECRIVIRDNSETPESEMLRHALLNVPPSVVLHFESPENPGFGRGHNLNFSSVRHGKDDVFLILNNDVRIPDAQAIAAMLEACTAQRIVSCVIETSASGNVWYAGGRIKPHTGDLSLDRAPFAEPFRSTGFITGCCMMLPAALFARLNGFDERFFMYAEDLDLCLRARALGAELLVVNRRIFHDVGSGEKGAYSDLYLYENTKNRLLCLRRHRLGTVPLGAAYFVLKYGLLRTVQLALHSPAPGRQIRAVWRGLRYGFLQNADTSHI